MTLEQYAYLAEIAGVVVVAVTLIFLTVQVRQNNSMLRSTATQSAHAQFAALYDAFVDDPSFVDVYLRATSDYSNLAATEIVRVNAWWMQVAINGQNWFLQTREGALHSSIMQSYEKLASNVMRNECFDAFWKARRFAFERTFVEHVEGLIAATPAERFAPLGGVDRPGPAS